MTWLIIIFIVALILVICCAKSIVVVKENEMGVVTTFGDPKKRVNSGLEFIIWPFQKIIKVPTTQQSITFSTLTVMTKKGKVKGYDEIIESAEISVDFTVYYYFDYDNLIETVKNAPGFTEEEMAEVLVPYMNNVLKALIGRMPWRLVNEEGYKFCQLAGGRMYPLPSNEKNYKLTKVEDDKKKGLNTFSITECDARLTKAELAKSPFVKFSLKDITLTSSDINFTDSELKNAISTAEKESLLATAEKRKADGEAYKVEKIGAAEAKARNAMIQIIKKEKDLEVLLTLRELAKGTSNTILYQLPRALETKVSELLGGNSPGETMKMLDNDSKKFFANLIEETIKNLKTTSGGI